MTHMHNVQNVRSTTKKTMERVFLTFLVVAGLAVRMFFIRYADKTLSWDSDWYFTAGQRILSGTLPADCCFHGAGYPFFISGILFFFGSDNVDAVRYAQAVMDVMTGVFLGIVAFRVFSPQAGITTLLLYLFNPFSSSYTGLIMTEVLTMFLISLMAYITSNSRYSEKQSSWLFSGCIMGAMYAVKPGFIWLIPLFLFLSQFSFLTWKHKIGYAAMFLAGVVFLSVLPLVTYYQKYKKPAFTPPYTMSIGAQLYMTYYLEPLSETLGADWPQNAEWKRAQMEYFHLFLADKLSDVPWYNRIYTEKFISQFPTMWPLFIQHVVQNFMHFWDKRNLYLHIDVFYPQDIIPVKIINGAYVICFIIGFLVSFSALVKRNLPLAALCFGIVFYVGFCFPLISNLPRHSYPLYPVIFLFAGKGLLTLGNTVRLLTRRVL